jgi:hypothetical protein
MKHLSIVALLFAVGCSGSSPTAPTPPPVVVTPPVIVVPPVVTNPLLSDPRFSLSFYRQLAHDSFEHPPGAQPLRRWTRPPMIYLRTVDERGGAVNVRLLEQTAAAIINTTGQWAGGAFGVAGLERGTDTREGQPGWITAKWSTTGVCGTVNGFGVEGVLITMNHLRPECTCGPLVVKHELGHAMGYYHTDSNNDLMATTFQGTCDKELSDREIFHARIAYSQPIGSYDPQ